jgi:hypothetical protein
MDHITHLSHLGQYFKIFSLHMHFVTITHNSCNVQGKSMPENPTGLYLWFMDADLNSFRDMTLPVKGYVRGTTPYGHDYIPSHVPRHKEQEYIWSMGGNLNSFQDIWKRTRDHIIWSWSAYMHYQMLLDTRNKSIYMVYGWESQRFSIY